MRFAAETEMREQLDARELAEHPIPTSAVAPEPMVFDPGRLHVGFCWRGTAHAKSMEFRDVFPLIGGIRRITVHCLQKGWVCTHARQRTQAHRLADWPATSNVIAGCDVIVTIDSKVAHVAGLLRVRTVLLLNANAQSAVWGTGRTTPLYPSMTILRGSMTIRRDLAAAVREAAITRTSA